MITVTGLEDFATTIRVVRCNDTGGHRAAVVVHGGTPYSQEIAHASAYLVDASWHATLIGSSELYGKDMYADVEILPPAAGATTCTVLMHVTEAAPFGSGSTGRWDVYDWPNSVPAPVAAAGGGGADATLRAYLRAGPA